MRSRLRGTTTYSSNQSTCEFALSSNVAMGEVGGGVGSAIASTAMVGSDSTVMPSTAEASAAVPNLEVSEVSIASTVMEAGMEMVAVMSTLAAATRITTSDLSTPAAVATFCCKLDWLLPE